MGEKDFEWGLVLIIASVVFLISGMDLLAHNLFSPTISSIIAYALVALGVYLIKK